MTAGNVGNMPVTRSRASWASAAAGSKCTIEMNVPPASSTPIIGRMKLMWNIGSGSQKRSPGTKRNRVRPASTAVRTSASWLSGAPLGIAVVPDV